MKSGVALLALMVAGAAIAGVKIGGVEFVPKDLIFADAEPRSRAMAEGPLPNECKWTFLSETRIGKHEEAQGCIRFYYRTSIALTSVCPAPNDKPATRFSERITATELRCPDSGGKVTPPNTEAKVLSSGTTSEGKHQEIVLQPDGTRITLVYDDAGVLCVIAFADGSGDSLRQP